MGQILSNPLTEKTIYYQPFNGNDPSKYLQFFSGVGSMKGYRMTQEDSHLICNGNNNHTKQYSNEDESHKDEFTVTFRNPFNSEKFNKKEKLNISMFAVFDGHGNEKISTYLSKRLNYWIKWALENHNYNRYPPSDTKTEINSKEKRWCRNFNTLQGLLAQIFKDAFIYQDQELYKHFAKMQCGSTAIVLIIVNRKTIYCCNTGDSRCILSTKPTISQQQKIMSSPLNNNNHTANNKVGGVRNKMHLHRRNNSDNVSNNSVANSNTKTANYEGNNATPRLSSSELVPYLNHKYCCVKSLSFDHKPLHIGELIRINDNGGVVSLGRVGGVLALSRAFGDFQFKKNNFVYHKSIPQEQQVSVEPDVIVHEIDYNKDEFLVLACDGIWDVYSNRNLVQFVRYHLALNIKFDEIVRKLLDRGISCADSNTGAGFDNMTVMLVALNKPNESHEYWYSRIKNRLEREKRIV